MSFLDSLIYGVRDVYQAGVLVTKASAINFASGATAVYNSATGSIDVTVSAGGASSLPVNRAAVEKGASYTLVSTTDHLVTFTGAGPWTATLPASPASGDEYVVANESAANLTVAGNGNAFLVAGSSTVAPGAAVTFIKSTTANWIAT